MRKAELESRFLPNPGSGELPELNLNDYEDTIPLVTPKETAEEIRTNLNPKKAAGFHMTTGTIRKKLQRNIGKTTQINASVRLILKLKLIIEKYQLVPSNKFGFRSRHSAIDQVHRMTDVIEKIF
jgi:hypothetical protein